MFFQNDVGDTTALEFGPELKVVAENTLGAKGGVFRASLIPCGGQWFTRSDKAAYCVGGKVPGGGATSAFASYYLAPSSRFMASIRTGSTSGATLLARGPVSYPPSA